MKAFKLVISDMGSHQNTRQGLCLELLLGGQQICSYTERSSTQKTLWPESFCRAAKTLLGRAAKDLESLRRELVVGKPGCTTSQSPPRAHHHSRTIMYGPQGLLVPHLRTGGFYRNGYINIQQSRLQKKKNNYYRQRGTLYNARRVSSPGRHNDPNCIHTKTIVFNDMKQKLIKLKEGTNPHYSWRLQHHLPQQPIEPLDRKSAKTEI